MKPKINIVSKINGVGLDQDVELVRSVLDAAGLDVTVSPYKRYSSVWRILQRNKIYDANIFMERVHSRWYGLAKKNILIPNQERFPRRLVSKLSRIDAVLTKSRHAQAVFSEFHPHVDYTSFTSRDLHDGGVARRTSSFFHLAGSSTLKGTEAILRVWNRHPDWPKLTLVSRTLTNKEELPDNIELISNRLSDAEVSELCNAHEVHLCPSRAEGWGHYIVEAMACGAVVVTTDAPPMNELVTAKRGVLVEVGHEKPRHLGTEFFVCEYDLERKLQSVIDEASLIRQSKGSLARQWYLENDGAFRASLANKVWELIGG